ncbi:MAG: hypothetical protein WCG80_16400 [Spirochaetales bacterium]
MKTLLWSVLVALALFFPVAAQPVYWGVLPSVLVEPYDDVEALEVNLIPLILGFELSPGLRLEVRPLVDLQLLEGRSPALSHLGGTFALTKTFFGESPGVSWHLGRFFSANVNAIDGGVVVISGVEPGVTWTADDQFSLTLSPQPGVDWFLRPGAGQAPLLPHLGLVVHFGWTTGETN